MSQYFPEPASVSFAPGICGRRYDLGEGLTIYVTTMAPNSELPPHSHEEYQVGMCLQGHFEVCVNGEWRHLNAFENAYAVKNNEMHSARNAGQEMAIGLDIKMKPSGESRPDAATFLNMTKEVTLKTGIECKFFATQWIEVMVSDLPIGAVMPVHAHSNTQVGISIDGDYQMLVGHEERKFSAGMVYYAPPNTAHGATNRYERPARSINLFIPPRYNKTAAKRVR